MKVLYGDDISGVHGYGHLTGGCALFGSAGSICCSMAAYLHSRLIGSRLLNALAPGMLLIALLKSLLLLVPCRYEGGQAEFARVLFGAPDAMLPFTVCLHQPSAGHQCGCNLHCLPSRHLPDRRSHKGRCYVLLARGAADFNLMKIPASGEDEK